MSAVQLLLPCLAQEKEVPKVCASAVTHGGIALCIGIILGIGLSLSLCFLWKTPSWTIYMGLPAGGVVIVMTYIALRMLYGTSGTNSDLSVSTQPSILTSVSQENPKITSPEEINNNTASFFPSSWTYGQDAFESLLQHYKVALSKQLLLKHGLLPSKFDLDQSEEKRFLSAIPSWFEWRTDSALWGKRIMAGGVFIVPSPSKIGCSDQLTDSEAEWAEDEKLYNSYIEEYIKNRSTLLTDHFMLSPIGMDSIPCYLCHGTSLSNAQSLLLEGFKDKYKTDYLLTHGLGVYLALTDEHAKVYAKEDGVILNIKVKPHANWASLDHRSWDNWKRNVLEAKIKVFLIEELKKIQSNVASTIPFLITSSDMFRHLCAELARDILTKSGYDAFYVRQSRSSLSSGNPPPDYIYLSSANLVESVSE